MEASQLIKCIITWKLSTHLIGLVEAVIRRGLCVLLKNIKKCLQEDCDPGLEKCVHLGVLLNKEINQKNDQTII